MAPSLSGVSHLVDEDFGPDPYFEKLLAKRKVACDEKHIEYMFRVVWPLLASLQKVIVGQRAMATYTGLGLFAVGDRDLEHLGAGHVLYSDYPGKGKTLLAGVPARVLGASYGRLQGDPEKSPTEYTGNRIIDIDEEGKKFFRLVKGPGFADIQLIDEVNRLSPDAMAALLEGLCEGYITVFGERHKVRPFCLFTMNPIETEGTRKLIEALLDRIMFKITGEWFTAQHFADILERTGDYKRIGGTLKRVCSIETVYEIREFFHENINVDRSVRERVGHFAEVSNDPHRFACLSDLYDQFGGALSKSGLLGRGAVHWEGAAKTLAAFRYRDYALEDDFLKVLIPIARHRMKFMPGVLEFFTEKWDDCLDTDATADRIIRQLVKEAW